MLELNFLQITFLAFVQGLTEFLPISSSGHLILPSVLFGWSDQGLAFDVALHVGSLVAVIFYFRQDLLNLIAAWIGSILGQGMNESAKLAWFIIAATIPAGFVGILFQDSIEIYTRSLPVIAFTSIFFGILLFVADRFQVPEQSLNNMTLKRSLVIGLFQAIALIPGVSRSGITITAGLFCGLSRTAATRFSFLLAIPLIAASGLLKGLEMTNLTDSQQWLSFFYASLVSALVSFICIHYFLKLVMKVGFLPFVVYRVGLGLLLLVIFYSA